MSDTPETDSQLGSLSSAPDDTAMWLEIGMPRRLERERNEAREQRDKLADALRHIRNVTIDAIVILHSDADGKGCVDECLETAEKALKGGES